MFIDMFLQISNIYVIFSIVLLINLKIIHSSKDSEGNRKDQLIR